MASFTPAFDKMIHNEGGFQLIDIAADRGGQTNAGITRVRDIYRATQKTQLPSFRRRPESSILKRLDTGLRRCDDFLEMPYKQQFWDKISGDALSLQATAETIFDFAVNAGTGTAAKLAQIVVGTVADGNIGPVTQEKPNALDEAVFVTKYALAKVARYAQICNKDRSQTKFLLGWINRTIGGLT